MIQLPPGAKLDQLVCEIVGIPLAITDDGKRGPRVSSNDDWNLLKPLAKWLTERVPGWYSGAFSGVLATEAHGYWICEERWNLNVIGRHFAHALCLAVLAVDGTMKGERT